MMSIKKETISMVQLPPPKSQKNLFHVPLTKTNNRPVLGRLFLSYTIETPLKPEL